MWVVYVAALVVGLGILVAQLLMGGHSADAHGSLGGHSGHDHDSARSGFSDDVVALFLSTRFWIFFALAFGLSGTLMASFALASPLVVALIAVTAGLASGLFAALAFRAVRRMSVDSSAGANDAVGRTGRVLVACSKGKVGQVRVALQGHSVDLLATTDEGEIARGQPVLIEDVRGEIAHVSVCPDELSP